jgi:hypothetical protein
MSAVSSRHTAFLLEAEELACTLTQGTLVPCMQFMHMERARCACMRASTPSSPVEQVVCQYTHRGGASSASLSYARRGWLRYRGHQRGHTATCGRFGVREVQPLLHSIVRQELPRLPFVRSVNTWKPAQAQYAVSVVWCTLLLLSRERSPGYDMPAVCMAHAERGGVDQDSDQAHQ